MARRVVITGMGIWSCIGTSIEQVGKALYQGQSGIILDSKRLDYGFRSALTGAVEAPVLKGLLDRRQRANMSEQAEYAYMATRQAFEQAGIDDAFLQGNEVGCIFGNDSSAKAVIEGYRVMEEKHDSELVGAGSVFQSMNSTVNMNLCSVFNLRGINFSVIADCICTPSPHPVLGTVLRLFVVPKDGKTINKKELAAHLTQKLEHHKVPQLFSIVNHIERTYNGKLNRKFYLA